MRFEEGTTRPDNDPEGVNHPSHYNSHPAGIECIDVIEYMSLNIGSAVKYLWRQGLKGVEHQDTELKKAIWFIERELDLRKRQADAKADGPSKPETEIS